MMIRTHLAAVLTLFGIVSVAALSACNTVEGAGKDIKSTGKAIEEEAQEHND